jgi:type II secretory pathway pseudopilin PulG
MLRTKSDRGQAGFGIPEIIIAIVLLGAVSLALTGMFRGILYIQSAAQHQKSATLAAQRQIESLRNSNFNDLVAGSTVNFNAELPSTLPSPKTGIVSVSEPVSGLKRVDVTVTYRHSGQDKQVKVSSTIGIIGITQ